MHQRFAQMPFTFQSQEAALDNFGWACCAAATAAGAANTPAQQPELCLSMNKLWDATLQFKRQTCPIIAVHKTQEENQKNN